MAQTCLRKNFTKVHEQLKTFILAEVYKKSGKLITIQPQSSAASPC